MAAIYTAVQFAQVHAESQSQMDFDASYRNWQHEQAVITAQLRAYIRAAHIDDRGCAVDQERAQGPGR